MARDRTTVREDHRPGNLRWAAEQLAIDEIRDPAKEEADRDRFGDDVRERKERDLAGAGEQQDCDRHAERTAMEGHPAMPDIERLERVSRVIARHVEEDIAEASAEDDAECGPYQKVVD